LQPPRPTFPRLCVFCGAASGNHPAFALAARELGKLLAHQHTELVYGGGNVGLMGEVANGILAHGGKAIGVITKLLETRELAHRGVQRLEIVETMHERKMLMATLADGFVALPGGLGTLDELFEILAWAQLGIHHKPVGLLNVEGFFDPVVKLIDHVRDTGFLRLDTQRTIVVRDNAADLLRAMQDLAKTPEPTRKQTHQLAP
jgi:hypothetical protein